MLPYQRGEPSASKSEMALPSEARGGWHASKSPGGGGHVPDVDGFVLTKG